MHSNENSKDFKDIVGKTLEENRKFIENEVGELHEAMENFRDFVLSYWDRYQLMTKSKEEIDRSLKYPEIWYVNHLLFPAFGSIATNLRIGNIRGCFMELRLLVETIVCCYKCQTMEELGSCRGRAGIMKEVDKELNLGKENGFAKLYGRLSDQVHSEKFNRWACSFYKDEKKEEDKEIIHSWKFMIPVYYRKETDIEPLKELSERIKEFMDLSKKVL